MKTFDHAGKVIAVTGGSRGIGEAVVRRLCSEGAHVFATFNSQPERAERISQEITETGGTITFHQVNVSDEESVKRFVEAIVVQAGRIDGLVNNAGMTKDGLIMRMSAKDWQDVIDTNLTGVFYACKAVARPMMSQRSGRIVNIGSIVGLGGNAGQVNYSSSKAGIVGLTRSLARELASRNVFVNCVAPGFVETDMAARLLDGPEGDGIRAQSPFNRVARPEELAKAVYFLASAESEWASGAVLDFNGASYLRM